MNVSVCVCVCVCVCVPEMLAVMVEVVCSLHTSTSDWREGDTLLRMQLFSYLSSLCAQNQANCK